MFHHATIDKLFCEEINLGAKFPRTVASGLRDHYTLEQMQDRRVLVVCNLPKRNMGKGKNRFSSLGMVLCAEKSVDGKATVCLICMRSGGGGVLLLACFD